LIFKKNKALEGVEPRAAVILSVPFFGFSEQRCHGLMYPPEFKEIERDSPLIYSLERWANLEKIAGKPHS
jgi:hypothetical protein